MTDDRSWGSRRVIEIYVSDLDHTDEEPGERWMRVRCDGGTFIFRLPFAAASELGAALMQRPGSADRRISVPHLCAPGRDPITGRRKDKAC